MARVPAAPPAAAITGLVRLGWRWVPGVTLTYRSVVTRELGHVVVRRAEDWAYTAESLDASGVARLSGELLGFGASVEVDGRTLSEDRLSPARAEERRLTPARVQVALRLSGRVVECSADGFAASLPHRALGIHFPPDPLWSGATWPDAGLLRAFEGALPIDTEVRSEATTGLGHVDPHADGWRATLTHQARLQAGDLGPALDVRGSSTWDTQPGAVAERHLEARWSPDRGADGRFVGLLRVDLVRLDPEPPPG